MDASEAWSGQSDASETKLWAGLEPNLAGSTWTSAPSHPRHRKPPPGRAGRRSPRDTQAPLRDREDQRMRELLDSILYSLLPAAFERLGASAPTGELSADDCRAVACAALVAAALVAAPAGFLEFLLCVPWLQLGAQLAASGGAPPPELVPWGDAPPLLRPSLAEASLLVNVRLDARLLDCTLDFLGRGLALHALPPLLAAALGAGGEVGVADDRAAGGSAAAAGDSALAAAPAAAAGPPTGRQLAAAALDGATPLHAAAMRAAVPALSHLLLCGADPMAPAGTGELPAQVVPSCRSGGCGCGGAGGAACRAQAARRTLLRRGMLSWGSGPAAWLHNLLHLLLCLLGRWAQRAAPDRPPLRVHAAALAAARRAAAAGWARRGLATMRAAAAAGAAAARGGVLTDGGAGGVDGGGAGGDPACPPADPASPRSRDASPAAPAGRKGRAGRRAAQDAPLPVAAAGGAEELSWEALSPAASTISPTSYLAATAGGAAAVFCRTSSESSDGGSPARGEGAALVRQTPRAPPPTALRAYVVAVQALRGLELGRGGVPAQVAQEGGALEQDLVVSPQEAGAVWAGWAEAAVAEALAYGDAGSEAVAGEALRCARRATAGRPGAARVAAAALRLALPTVASRSATLAGVWQVQRALADWGGAAGGAAVELGAEARGAAELSAGCLAAWARSAVADLGLAAAALGEPPAADEPLAGALRRVARGAGAHATRAGVEALGAALDALGPAASAHVSAAVGAALGAARAELDARERLEAALERAAAGGAEGLAAAGGAEGLEAAAGAAEPWPRLAGLARCARDWAAGARAAAGRRAELDAALADAGAPFSGPPGDVRALLGEVGARSARLAAAAEAAAAAGLDAEAARKAGRALAAQATAAEVALAAATVLANGGRTPGLKSLVNKAAAAAATAAAQPLVDFTPGSDMLDPVLQAARARLAAEKAAEALTRAVHECTDLARLDAAISAAQEAEVEEVGLLREAHAARARLARAQSAGQGLEEALARLEAASADGKDAEHAAAAALASAAAHPSLADAVEAGRAALARWRARARAGATLTAALEAGADSEALDAAVRAAAAAGAAVGEARRVLRAQQALERSLSGALAGRAAAAELEAKLALARREGVRCLALLESAARARATLELEEAAAALRAALDAGAGGAVGVCEESCGAAGEASPRLTRLRAGVQRAEAVLESTARGPEEAFAPGGEQPEAGPRAALAALVAAARGAVLNAQREAARLAEARAEEARCRRERAQAARTEKETADRQRAERLQAERALRKASAEASRAEKKERERLARMEAEADRKILQAREKAARQHFAALQKERRRAVPRPSALGAEAACPSPASSSTAPSPGPALATASASPSHEATDPASSEACTPRAGSGDALGQRSVSPWAAPLPRQTSDPSSVAAGAANLAGLRWGSGGWTGLVGAAATSPPPAGPYPEAGGRASRQAALVAALDVARQPEACRYFVHGYCREGRRCRFAHALPHTLPQTPLWGVPGEGGEAPDGERPERTAPGGYAAAPAPGASFSPPDSAAGGETHPAPPSPGPTLPGTFAFGAPGSEAFGGASASAQPFCLDAFAGRGGLERWEAAPLSASLLSAATLSGPSLDSLRRVLPEFLRGEALDMDD
uniref:C3H1-type domain-containing protein n=1 Tax=Auxenochlorella protothecoides TaxID=3075 RepID=A0A1D1ZP32_AUXPR